MPYKSLTKADILRALNRLGELAQAKGVVLEVALYGGAVFTVVYGSRDSTKDVDAVAQPSAVARQLARQVASEQELPEDWLNEDVRQFLASVEEKRRLASTEIGPGLAVSIPTAAYLLAMKVNACRAPLPGYAGDQDDILFLVRKMGFKSFGEVEAVYRRFFPHDEIPAAHQAVIQALVERARQP
jgi:hypothetical protein